MEVVVNTAKFYDLGVARQQRSNRVENQKLGFIPLYRSIKNKSWAKDVYLRALWENLLLEAQSEPYTANYKGHIWQRLVNWLPLQPI